jgi:ABC-type multidrug transport system fused ATPase/permease subunit
VTLRLVSYVRRHWAFSVLAFICLTAGTAFSLIIPKALGRGVDVVLSSGQSNQLYLAAGLIIGSSAMRGLAGYGNRLFTEVLSQRVAYDMRNALYDHLQKLSFAYYDKAQTGQLMSRATVDIEATRTFVSQGLLQMIQTALLVGGVAVILLLLDWRLALMTLAFVPVIVWRVLAVSNTLRPIWLNVQQLIADLGATLQEALTGIREVKGFARESEQSQKFAGDARRLYDEQIRAARKVAINTPTLALLLIVPTALVLWYGGRQVIAGTLTIGGVTQFILYTGMLTMPIRRLGGMANMYSRFMSAGQRIVEVLDTRSPVSEKPNALRVGRLKGRVTFENASFSYNLTSPTIEDISFDAEPGQLVALVGESGSGKSTIVNLIMRFYDVTAGRVLVDDNDVRDIEIASLRKNIGIAQQDVFVFGTTIRENIAYGVPSATAEQIRSAARAAQIDDFIQSLPEGYDTLVGERGRTLSGGEKQRITIARALLVNPSILILDEITSNVDSETERRIRLAIDALIKDRTTFIISHRLPIITNADLILVLKNGRIVERGRHDALLGQGGYYAQTYGDQLTAGARGRD